MAKNKKTTRNTSTKVSSKGSESRGRLSENNKYLLALIGFSVINIVLWQFPIGRLIIYPFTILGTWFHEMGHGLMAMFLGGSFHELEIFANGSGVAKHSGNLFGGPIGRALVAAAGPLGPAVAGAGMISAVKGPSKTKAALWILSIVMVVSVLYFVRSWFGILFISIFAVVSIYINLNAKEKTKRYLLLFLGTQAVLSTYISIDYLLSPGANIGGEVMPSDSMQIANNLFLPYGFWGVLMIFISALIIWISVSKLIKK